MESRACTLRQAAVSARRTTETPAARRAVVLGARQSFPAVAVRRLLSGATSIDSAQVEVEAGPRRG